MIDDLTLTLAAPNPEGTRSPGDLAPPPTKKEKKRIRPETPLYNVKELLSTGLLEGVPVSYVSAAGEVLLEGAVKDLGYQCGCRDCNNAVVLCAATFEKHANATTNNPNNRVCFKSGISIYNLVKVLENHRLESLDKVIKDKVGCPVNIKHFEDWKASFEKEGKGVQKTRRSGVELQKEGEGVQKTRRSGVELQKEGEGVQKTRRSGVELPQTQTGVQHQRSSANVENVQIQQELHSEPCLDKIVGVENLQTNTWLQLQTPCEKNSGDLPTQQEALTEPCPDKINGERQQNRKGLKLQTAGAIGSGIGHTGPGLNTEPHSDEILISRSVETLQSLRGLQHQRACANDYENLPTQLGLHTEPCSDKSGNDVESSAQGLLLLGACANGYEPMETLPVPHTEAYSGERNGVQNVHARTGVQLQRARANSYPAIHTQPGAHSKPYSNERNKPRTDQLFSADDHLMKIIRQARLIGESALQQPEGKKDESYWRRNVMCMVKLLRGERVTTQVRTDQETREKATVEKVKVVQKKKTDKKDKAAEKHKAGDKEVEGPKKKAKKHK